MTEPALEDAVRSCEQAAVAELAYQRADGSMAVVPVVPLVEPGACVLALPYGDVVLAEALQSGGRAVLVCSDSRLALKGWRSLAVRGPVSVRPDPEGERFIDHGLLGQELRKHPPSRALADTPLLRREHWWFVPRLIATLRPEEVFEVGRRAGPWDGVLVWREDGSLGADTVAVDDWDAERIEVVSLAGRTLPSGPVVLGTHDFSVPDMEQRTACTITGRLDDGTLAVSTRDGSLGLKPVAGLLARLRAHRDLGRRCRAGLAQHGV